jgi:diguanylate cyclase (GGDEF)-like protein/PAS domain S-box-containing protein
MESSRKDAGPEAKPGGDEPTKDHPSDMAASSAPYPHRGYTVGGARRTVHIVPRVLLVHAASDSPEVTSVRRLLEELAEPPRVEEADSLAAARERLSAPPLPDLVLVDGSRPDEGLQTLGDLASRSPAPLWVLVVPDGYKGLGEAAVARGLDDYLVSEDIDAPTLTRILRYAKRRHAAEADLREEGERYRALFERTPDGILVVDEHGITRDANLALAEMFGYEPRQLIGNRVEILLPSAVRDLHVELRREYAKYPLPRPMGQGRNLTGLHRDGSSVPVEVGLAPVSFGGEDAVVASVRDLRGAEERRRLADLVDASDDVVLGALLNGTVESWNGGAERYFGLTREEAVGHLLSDFLAPEVIEELPEILRRVRAGEHVRSVENFLVTEDGRRAHLSFSFSPLTDRHGEVTGAAVIGRDITRRKLLEADLEELAYQDPLTRVANRRFLRERLQYALSLARREHHGVGLVYLDLNGFKEVNDRFGHSAGDAVLKEVARRLEDAKRDSDLVARFGGDEFVILLSKVDGKAGAVEAARRFDAAFDSPVHLGTDVDVSISAQFGIALYPDHGTEADPLLDAADRALYSRKKGRGLTPSAPGLDEERMGMAVKPKLESQLRAALQEAQFHLYCQPITRAVGGELAGVELLLRWRRPGEEGVLSANEFLPSARDLGLMPEIDRWVLSRALDVICDRGLPSSTAWFAVNVSDQTLRSVDAVSTLASLVEDRGLPAGRLRLEIRESPAIVSPHLLAAIERLGALGVAVVLDNYGVGHSSIAELREMPAVALKLDGLLLRTLDRDRDGGRILHAAMELGAAAGMQVGVAGVERVEQADYLLGNGCDFLQGHYFGRPVPLEEMLA